MQFLGLDVGTQSTKGMVIDDSPARIVSRAAVPHELISGLPAGAAEQHPRDWISAVVNVVAQLTQSPGVQAEEIRGIGVSGQQHGFVALDAHHEVIRPAKLWCDSTTSREARELSERFGRHVPAGFTASKILWLKRHEPEHYARLRWVLLPHDYVNFWLTHELTMEAGDASGTGFFDPVKRAFSIHEMQHIDTDLPSKMPKLVAAGSVIGPLASNRAQQLHLRAGIPVATGGGDNMMSAIGSGATLPGQVVLSLGTSGTVFTYSSTPIVDPEGLIAPFCDSTGAWLPLLCVMNLTGVTEEVRRAFGLSHEVIMAKASEVEPGCGGLSFLPFLQGERVPDLPNASGVLSGIRSGHLQPGPLFRAALEGTSLNLALGVERMRKLGITLERVRVVGGGARNALWREILAQVLNARVQLMAEPESAALGAALQAMWTVERTSDPNASLTKRSQPFLSTECDDAVPQRSLVDRYRVLRGGFEERLRHEYGIVT